MDNLDAKSQMQKFRRLSREGPDIANLAPPRRITHKFPDVEQVYEEFEVLQYILFETNRPETVDRSATPRVEHEETELTITILSNPKDCFSLLLEGARQCPGDMLLVLSPTWISKVPSKVNPGLYSLLVFKAISFDLGCISFVDEFVPPRRTTYLVNFRTNFKSNGQCIEHQLDCAMGGNAHLSLQTYNKLFTRILLANKNFDVPETLAFPFKCDQIFRPETSNIIVFPLDSMEGADVILHEKLKEFKSWDSVDSFMMLVVKATGERWVGRRSVTYHMNQDEAGILSAMKHLLAQFQPGDILQVEPLYRTFIPIHPLFMGDKATAANPSIESGRLGFTVRATVCRLPDNTPETTSITCGVCYQAQPRDAMDTIPQGLDTTLYDWGVVEPDERIMVSRLLRMKSELAMAAILEFEKTLTAEQRGNIECSTDVIRVDFKLIRKRGAIWPVAIDLKTLNFVINDQIFENMNRNKEGQTFGPLVHTMIYRCQQTLLANTDILVIGAGNESKRFIWETAKNWNIKVVLVDSNPNHFAKDLVSTFIHYDISDHKQDETHCTKIIELVGKLGITLDGCLSFCDDSVVLAALVCQQLDLVGNPPGAVLNARMKSRAHEILIQEPKLTKHLPRPNLYACEVFCITSHEDITKASRRIGFPATMRLEFQTGRPGAKLVENEAECHAHFDQIQRDMQDPRYKEDFDLGFDSSMSLMELLHGTDHDINLVMFRHRLLAAVVCDYGPPRLPWMTETAFAMPSYLERDKKNMLITAAYQCCLGIGLANGTFSVEMRMTPCGPKLIKINPRMGAFQLRDWILKVFAVDFLFCSFAIAAGIKMLLKPLYSRGHMVGVMLVRSEHREHLSSPAELSNLKRLHETGVLHLNIFDSVESLSRCDSPYETPFCMIAVMESNGSKAKEKLFNVCRTLHLISDTYPILDFLASFEDGVDMHASASPWSQTPRGASESL